MQRISKGVLVVAVVVTCGALAFVLGDSRNFLAWPRAQGFVSVPAENRALEPALPGVSRRPVDPERTSPSPGAAAEALIAGQGGTAFPVLLPYGFGATVQTMAASRLRLRLLEDGYYSVFQSMTMEITIIGTRMVWHPGAALAPEVQADYVMPFEDPGPIPAGGAMTFGHFGVDYSVTFDCIDTDPGLTQNCITAEAAEAFVSALTEGLPTDLLIPPSLSS